MIKNKLDHPTEFIQTWQPYRFADKNRNYGWQQTSAWDKWRGTYITINVSDLNELKQSTMLEF